MGRVILAIVLILGPAFALRRAIRAGAGSAWRLLSAGAMGGVASGVTLLIVVTLGRDFHESAGSTLIGLIGMAVLGGAGVGVIIGSIVLAIRAWLRTPEPRA